MLRCAFLHKQNWNEKPEEEAQLSPLGQQTAVDRHAVSQSRQMDRQEHDSILDPATSFFFLRNNSLVKIVQRTTQLHSTKAIYSCIQKQNIAVLLHMTYSEWQ